MTPAEQYVFDRLTRNGAKVINKGWPDLLVELNGRIVAIEIKQGHDTVKPHQNECHELLRQAGIPVQVYYVTASELADERTRRKYNPTPKELSERVSEALERVFPAGPQETASLLESEHAQ